MPRLKNVKIEVESQNPFTLYLRNEADQITLEWECYPPYRPDSRVAKAWNFDLNDIETYPRREDLSFVILRTWPPNTGVEDDGY